MRSAQRFGWLVFLLVIISSQVFPFSKSLRIVESGMSAAVSEKEVTIVASIMNDAEEISGNLHIDLLDPKDSVVASANTTERLKPGRNTTTLHLMLPAPHKNSDSDPVLWYRLRYRLLSDDKIAAAGLVALGAITPDLLELRIAHAEKALPGQAYHVRVRAANPVTKHPVSDRAGRSGGR